MDLKQVTKVKNRNIQKLNGDKAGQSSSVVTARAETVEDMRRYRELRLSGIEGEEIVQERKW